MPGISHEPIRYETPFDNRGWLHVLFGHVPGYQQDYILHPRLPEQGFTGQHLGLLLSHFKSQEPRYADSLAFSIANLKPWSATQSPTVVALIVAVRIQGAKDPHGRDRPLLAHAIIAVDRQLTPAALREAFAVFTAPFAGRLGKRQERAPQRTQERPIDSWYHEYQAAHDSLLGDPAAQLRFLGQYVRRFAGLPTLAPTLQAKDKGTQPTAAPPLNKRVTYIDYPDDATTLQLGTWATELACVLAGSSLPWSSVQFGGQPPGLSLPPVENGLTVQFIPEHERVPQYAETDRISHDRFRSAQAQEQLGSLFGLDVQPPPQRGEDQGRPSFSSGQHSVPSDSGDPLSSSAEDSSDPSPPRTPVAQPTATEPGPSPASLKPQFYPEGPLPTARPTSTVAPTASQVFPHAPALPPPVTSPVENDHSLMSKAARSRPLLVLLGVLLGCAIWEVQTQLRSSARRPPPIASPCPPGAQALAQETKTGPQNPPAVRVEDCPKPSPQLVERCPPIPAQCLQISKSGPQRLRVLNTVAGKVPSNNGKKTPQPYSVPPAPKDSQSTLSQSSPPQKKDQPTTSQSAQTPGNSIKNQASNHSLNSSLESGGILTAPTPIEYQNQIKERERAKKEHERAEKAKTARQER